CPLAQNWPFDQGFLRAWLGNSLFDQVFHPHYRDLIPLFQFVNDLHYVKGGDVHYRRVNLTELCNLFGLERRTSHDALNDALATAEVYKRALSKYSGGFNVN